MINPPVLLCVDSVPPFGQIDFDEFYEYMVTHHDAVNNGEVDSKLADIDPEEWSERLDQASIAQNSTPTEIE